jgi:MFS superfamily sulfate permease-like transporter
VPQSYFSNLRNDFFGGLVSAAVAIPLAMGFGMFALVSLGDEYFADGARAGLITAFVVGVVAVVLGARNTVVYAPRIVSTFFLGTVLYGLVHSDLPALKSGGTMTILIVFFAINLLGGVLQFLFGLVRLGTLIKFAPHPVIAGFQNAAAILLFLVQTGNVLGFDRNTPYMQALRHAEQAKPLNVVVAVFTFVVMWNAKRWVPRVPPLITALAAGTALYYALWAAGMAHLLGPVIGAAPPSSVSLYLLPDFAGVMRLDGAFALVPTVLLSALALAIIASFDALLCAKLAAQAGDPPINGDRLLIRLGAGNAMTASVGGITSGINIGASLTNRAFGGRTPLSVLINGGVLLLILTVLFPVAVELPRVVLSAIIMVIAVQHLDAWSLRSIRRLFTVRDAYSRILALDVFVVVLVAVLSVTIDIVLAVFLGIAIAAILFMIHMSRSVTRRSYRGDAVHSRKSRPEAQQARLERDGHAILIIELQGALFFGSAERLSAEINSSLSSDTRYVILDFARVTEIDSTGAQILAELRRDCAAQQRHLLISRAAGAMSAARLGDFGIHDTDKQSVLFRDIDRAIEWAEDHILSSSGRHPAGEEISLQSITLRHFDSQDIAALAAQLERRSYQAGDVVFRQGEAGRELFLVTKGTASAYLFRGDGHDIRLATFAPGTVFGELAILDKGPRSASIVADSQLTCLVLSDEHFAALSMTAPSVSIKLLQNLGHELSGRLRRANQAISQLEG